MYPFKNILLPTDFSPNSRSAIKYAAGFGHRYGASIYLHNAQECSLPPQALILSDRSLSDYGYDWITGIKKELKNLSNNPLFNGLNVHVLLSEGRAIEEINRMITLYNIDLVTMATNSRSGLKGYLAGSCATTLMMTTDCPILFTRIAMHDFIFQKQGQLHFALNKILFATNFEDEAAKQLAIRLAQDNNSELTIMHSLGSVLKYLSALSFSDKSYEDIKQQAAAKLKQTQQQIEGLKVETILTEGKFYHEVERITAEQDIDLIVVGNDAHPSSGFSSSGGGAERIIRTATRPVLVVKNSI